MGSSQHFFPNFSKNYIIVKKGEISNLFPGKATDVIKKVIKNTYNILLWLLLFFTFLLSYERLKAHFQTSAKEICAILGHFPILYN